MDDYNEEEFLAEEEEPFWGEPSETEESLEEENLNEDIPFEEEENLNEDIPKEEYFDEEYFTEDELTDIIETTLSEEELAEEENLFNHEQKLSNIEKFIVIVAKETRCVEFGESIKCTASIIDGDRYTVVFSDTPIIGGN